MPDSNLPKPNKPAGGNQPPQQGKPQSPPAQKPQSQPQPVVQDKDSVVPPPSALKTAPPPQTTPTEIKPSTQTVSQPVQQGSPIPPQGAQSTPPAPPGLPPRPPSAAPPGQPAPTPPPTSLSALSSMVSSRLPKGATEAQVPQPPAGSPPPTVTPKVASVKKSPLKFLPVILGLLLFVGVLIFAAMKFFGGSEETTDPNSPNPPTGEAVTLEYWGLWEPGEVLSSVISDFETQNPGVKVRYSKQSHQDYRERLQTAIASGNGPDVYRFHASWTPMLSDELAPMPASVMSSSEFQQTFYPVAAKQLQVNGQIVGVPLMYDGLALYYNKEVFRTAGVQPPQTWSELRTMANQLTVRSSDQIERAGLAIGTSTNVEHFSDIVAVLMLQNGADLNNPNSPEGRDALKFYTNFMTTDKVWSETLPNSTTAFARGDVAMMFAPSWRAHEIKAANPQLEFGIAPLPKLTETRISWATYWAEGVHSKSKKQDASWRFLKYMSSAEVLKKLYSEQSKVRAFGEIYPRKDMASELAGNELVAPYLQDAPFAQGWYLSSFTHDNGLNDQIIKYYEDGISAIVGGKSVEDSLVTIDQGTKQVLRQYGASGAGAR